MTNIEKLKLAVEAVRLHEQKMPEFDPNSDIQASILSEGRQWFRLGFLQALIAEIEELEVRCAEKPVHNFTVGSNFDGQEFQKRFI